MVRNQRQSLRVDMFFCKRRGLFLSSLMWYTVTYQEVWLWRRRFVSNTTLLCYILWRCCRCLHAERHVYNSPFEEECYMGAGTSKSTECEKQKWRQSSSKVVWIRSKMWNKGWWIHDRCESWKGECFWLATGCRNSKGAIIYLRLCGTCLWKYH